MLSIGREHLKDYRELSNKILTDCNDLYIEVNFDDATEKIKRNYVIIYLYIWRLLYKWDLPFLSKYRFKDNVIDDKMISKILTEIYDDAVRATGDTSIQYDFWYVFNDLRKFILKHCNKYHTSLSRVGIAKTMKQPAMQDVLRLLRYNKHSQTGEVENKLNRARDKMVDVLTDPKALEYNEFLKYLQLGTVNPKQLQQVLLGVGTRADINDRLITYPIKSAFYTGLNTIEEAMTEFVTAKKSAVYNKAGVPDASVYSKSVQVITSFCKFVYDHDCGNELYFPYHVVPGTSHNFIGKRVKQKDGSIVEITEFNHKDFDNRLIHFRTIFGCKHKDGFCKACAGHASNYYARHLKAGTISAVALSKPTVQSVLSAKHHQTTRTVEYVLKDMLEAIMRVKGNEIYLRKDAVKRMKEDFYIAIPLSLMNYITDLFLVDNLDAINEDYFSNIWELSIIDKKTNENIMHVKDMAYNKCVPYFSVETLKHIKEHYDDMPIINNHLCLDLKKFDFDQPVFRTPIINDSIMLFVNRVKRFSGSKIRNSKNIITAFKELTHLIYNRVNLNILHLEVMLRANLVTNKYNYTTPVLTQETLDSPVTLASNQDVMLNKSVGTLMIRGQQLHETLSKPETYLLPRQGSDYDKHIGL